MNGEMWSVERETQLRTLWAEGATASEIRSRMGGLSRSAVLGKVARLGLARRKLPTVEWPKEQTDKLRTWFAEGCSYGLIAQRLGHVNRAAVIAKCKRLGLRRASSLPTVQKYNPRSSGSVPSTRRKQGAVRNLTRILAKANGHDPGLEDSLATPVIDDRAIPEAQRRSLLELNESVCHWPVGNPTEPGFFFCAGSRTEGSPYCAGHHARAYRGRS